MDTEASQVPFQSDSHWRKGNFVVWINYKCIMIWGKERNWVLWKMGTDTSKVVVGDDWGERLRASDTWSQICRWAGASWGRVSRWGEHVCLHLTWTTAGAVTGLSTLWWWEHPKGEDALAERSLERWGGFRAHGTCRLSSTSCCKSTSPFSRISSVRVGLRDSGQGEARQGARVLSQVALA